MNYFIDFEATQYNQEIISIGCEREDGKTFYSLIKPKKIKNVTKFISELTGITKEKLKNEKSSDEVFSNFFDWIFENDDSTVKFYCYGNSDIDFLKKNLTQRTNNIKAQAVLSLIISNLINYSDNIKERFSLIKPISLKKLMDYFYPEDETLWHHALNDAKMLHMVYQAVESEREIEKYPFPNYMGIPFFKNKDDFEFFYIESIDEEGKCERYESIDEAVAKMANYLNHKGNSDYNIKNIYKRIIHAINWKDFYFKKKWKACFKKEE